MKRTGRSWTLAVAAAVLLPGLCGNLHAAAPRPLNARASDAADPDPASAHAVIYRLHMHHLHTGESIDVAYKRNDEELPGGIAMLNHFLRDHRTDEEADYPVEEFDLLHALMIKLHKPDGLIEIVCGYRSEASNEYLRSLSPETGVAEHSQHVLSKAIDIRVPGVSTDRLRDAALSLEMGGVGYYPRSGFVHVDVGDVRQWSFGVPLRRVSSRRSVGRRGTSRSATARHAAGGRSVKKRNTALIKTKRRR